MTKTPDNPVCRRCGVVKSLHLILGFTATPDPVRHCPQVGTFEPESEVALASREILAELTKDEEHLRELVKRLEVIAGNRSLT